MSMIDSNVLSDNVLKVLDDVGAEYKIFSHREALTWEELELVQKETGFFGTEMKCMVLRVDNTFIVYLTLQGKRVNFEAIKETLGTKKVKLCSPEDLMEYFGAKPGCAYPFGFDTRYDIYVDPTIYEQSWVLFSPVIPTKTVQVKGSDLRRIFSSLENRVHQVVNFNLGT